MSIGVRVSMAAAAVAMAAWSTAVAAPVNDGLNARISRVEAGLLPEVPVRGRPAAKLADKMAELHVPGVSVAVIRDGRIEWARGYGVIEAGGRVPVSAGTLFQAASISKPVTAAGALALAERGKLDLNADVNRSLRSWKLPDSELMRREKVTPARILTHTAGLTVHGFDGYEAGAKLPRLVDVLNGRKPANSPPVRVDTVPGSAWRYSGGGYCVLQQLLIDVTRVSFPEYMQRAVLKPLGMSLSTYEQPLPERLRSSAAAAHLADGKMIPGRWHHYPELAAAGLWTTPSDLARFVIEVQTTVRSGKGRMLSAAMAKRMVTPLHGRTGMGLFLDGRGSARRFSHGGSNAGYRCEMVGYLQKGLGAVVMTNGDNGDELSGDLLRAIAKEYGWPGYLSRERVVAPLAPGVAEIFAGNYRSSDRRRFQVIVRNRRLILRLADGRELEMYPQSKDHFFVAEARVEIAFGRDDKGKVTELILSGVLNVRARRD